MVASESHLEEINPMPHSEPSTSIRKTLLADGLITPEAEITPLTGGVSSDVFRVYSRGSEFVVKRALAKLRVAADWHAPLDRNHYEHRYLSVAGEIAPKSFPAVLHVNDDEGYFTMSWLGEGWDNWKEQMLGGICDPETASLAGKLMGDIHRETANRPDLRAEFPTDKNFDELRLDPYLRATAEKHPNLKPLILQEIDRIANTHDGLVHGDFSPKNILVRPGEIILLDCEVAWYGDTSFDPAFLLNHLLLKSLYHAPAEMGLSAMFEAATTAYISARGFDPAEADLWSRKVARLLLMLLLARVDGKSPAEYIAPHEEKKAFIRSFVTDNLSTNLMLQELSQSWFSNIIH